MICMRSLTRVCSTVAVDPYRQYMRGRLAMLVALLFYLMAVVAPSEGKTLFQAQYDQSHVDADYAVGDTTAAPIAYRENHGECSMCKQTHDGYQLPRTIRTGRFGGALDLTNVNHNITYVDSKNFNPIKGTAELWFVIDDDPEGSYHPLFGWFSPPILPDKLERDRALYVHIKGNQITLTMFTPHQSSKVVVVDGLEETGKWHHLEINWDCTDGDGQSRYNVYLDGQIAIRISDGEALVDDADTAIREDANKENPGSVEGRVGKVARVGQVGRVHLGIWDSGWGHFLRGRIDEFRITDQIEHEDDFAPPKRAYAMPGTSAGIAMTYLQARSDLQLLKDRLAVFDQTHKLLQGQVEIRADLMQVKADSARVLEQMEPSIKAVIALFRRQAQDAGMTEENWLADFASQTKHDEGDRSSHADIQSTLDESADAVRSARYAMVNALGKLYTLIPDIYNQTIVNLGYLRDEQESLQRATHYIKHIGDKSDDRWIKQQSTRSQQVSRQAEQAIDKVSESLEKVCRDFYALFKGSAINQAEPIPALSGFAKNPNKRKQIEAMIERLSADGLVVADARKAIADTFNDWQADPVLQKQFPDYRVVVPAPLPPVSVAPDGALKRVIFAGPGFGRVKTLLSLGFDTMRESGAHVEWTAEDQFDDTPNSLAVNQWDEHQVPLSTTVLHYAIGAGMYRPRWFNAEEDMDYYLRPGPHNVNQGGLEFRHPLVRDMIRRYLEEAARINASRPYTFIYKGPWEAHPYTGASVRVPGERTVAFKELGYSNYAVKAFRNYLQNKYESIANLNQIWRTSYASFEAIEPPEAHIRAFIVRKNQRGQEVHIPFFPSKRVRATPLTYEFERCRKDLYVDYLSDSYQAIRRGDPQHPLASSTSGGIMDEILVNGLDDLLMLENGVDMWGKHPSGGIGWSDSPYMWGLNRYFKKTLVSLEYYGWGQEEIGNDFWPSFQLASDTSSELIYNASRRDIWHELSWDRRMLVFYWTQKLVEMQQGVSKFKSPLVRSFATMIPVVKRRTEQINEQLFDVPVMKPRIGVLHSGPSNINAFPTNNTQRAADDIFNRLIAKQYHFGIVPEKFIVEGRDTLDNYDVIILPYVQYSADGFDDMLKSWVHNGGTLIAAGPFGLYDQYGFDIEHGLRSEALPDYEISYPTPGDYDVSSRWEATRKGRRVKKDYIKTTYGRGTILFTLDGRALRNTGALATSAYVGIEIGGDNVQGKTASTRRRETSQSDGIRPLALPSDDQLSEPVKAFYDVLSQATQRKAWVNHGNVEMVIRQEKPGEALFVSLLNWNYREPLKTQVMVQGEYDHVVDLSMPGGFPVPVTIEKGMTIIPVVLGPGEGLMLKLQSQ